MASFAVALILAEASTMSTLLHTEIGKRIFLVMIALAGCATTSPRRDLHDVQSIVSDRTSGEVALRTELADELVARRTAELLAKPLDSTSATELAVLHNRRLAVTLEEVGIARADLVQSGLLENPTLTAGIGFPLGAGVVAPQVGISFDLLGIFLLPLRQKLAGHELEAAKLRVGDSVLDLVAQVQEGVVVLQAGLQTLELLRQVAESEEQGAQLAQRQFAAGNVNSLDASLRQATAAEARLAVEREQLETQTAREVLGRLLGLPASVDGWSIRTDLAPLPAEEPKLHQMEELAVARRLDLQAANAEIAAHEEAVELVKSGRFAPNLGVGANLERDAEGATTLGPTLGMSLPIFDQGQARLARAVAELAQSRARRDELELAIRSETRIGDARLRTARELAQEYREVLVPLKARVVQLSQRHYNAMLIGVFALLEAKRSELATQRSYIESIRDYWIARARLERAIGGASSKRDRSPTPGDKREVLR